MMGSRHLNLWLGLSLLGILPGCSRPVSSVGLAGTYVADYGLATDTLTIKADGHFTQAVKVKSTRKVEVAKGTWTYDPQGGYIRFANMILVVDYAGNMIPRFAQQKRDGDVAYPVETWLGQLQINADPGVPYRRQANLPAKKPPSRTQKKLPSRTDP